jgi:hypothetical protein
LRILRLVLIETWATLAESILSGSIKSFDRKRLDGYRDEDSPVMAIQISNTWKNLRNLLIDTGGSGMTVAS